MGIDEPGAVNIIPISRAENICFGLKIPSSSISKVSCMLESRDLYCIPSILSM